MQSSGFGLGLLVLGVAIFLVFATADLTGLGADPRFGVKQIVGCAAGLGLAGWGAYAYLSRRA
jgi:hypothetical protein